MLFAVDGIDPSGRPAESEVLGASLEGGLSKSSRSRLAKFLISAFLRQFPLVAINCHENVMVVTLNSRAQFERYPNNPGFSDEPGLFLRQAPLSLCLGAGLNCAIDVFALIAVLPRSGQRAVQAKH